jgi:hypothetical protein
VAKHMLPLPDGHIGDHLTPGPNPPIFPIFRILFHFT